MRGVVVIALLAACRDPSEHFGIDAYVDLDAPAHAGAGPGGGLLDELRFAVVGDTRPASIDDTSGYPSDIAAQIWTDVQTEAPPFAITTGDYIYASTDGAEAGPQLELYLAARAAYGGLVYPALGNHECTGFTASNCGPGNTDGQPSNYTEYLAHMLPPIGETRPYFVERFAATDGSWSAKLVFVAANAWTAAQRVWLDQMLAEPTTYTFVVRHEPDDATSAPGVRPSQQVIATHPVTMLIVGHAHTYRHVAASREIVVGNGGAPLSTGSNYGYVIVARQPDGSLQITSYDYATHAVVDQFAIAANGAAL